MLLGIDYGTAKIGLAISEDSKDALPLALSILRYKNLVDLKDQLTSVLNDYVVDAFIVGTLLEQQAGDQTKRKSFENFETMLTEFSIPIKHVDEKYSTQAAKSLGKDDPNFKTKHDDALAAQVILETYLANHGRD